jgi:hypothetical protein
VFLLCVSCGSWVSHKHFLLLATGECVGCLPCQESLARDGFHPAARPGRGCEASTGCARFALLSPGLLSRTAVCSDLFFSRLLEPGLRLFQTVHSSSEGASGVGASQPNLVCCTKPAHLAETSEANRAQVCYGRVCTTRRWRGRSSWYPARRLCAPCLFWSSVAVKSARAKCTFPHQPIRKQVTPVPHLRGAAPLACSLEWEGSTGLYALRRKVEPTTCLNSSMRRLSSKKRATVSKSGSSYRAQSHH